MVCPFYLRHRAFCLDGAGEQAALRNSGTAWRRAFLSGGAAVVSAWRPRRTQDSHARNLKSQGHEQDVAKPLHFVGLRSTVYTSFGTQAIAYPNPRTIRCILQHHPLPASAEDRSSLALDFIPTHPPTRGANESELGRKIDLLSKLTQAVGVFDSCGLGLPDAMC
jgi:hypothetical protein